MCIVAAVRGALTGRLVLSIAAVGAVAALAGCGGGGDTSGSSSSIPKDEFVEQANAICAKGKKEGLAEMAAYVRKQGAGSPQAKAELLQEALRTVFIPAVQKQIDEVRALGAPDEGEEQVDAFLASMQKAVDQAGEKSSAGPQFASLFKSSAALAHEYGIDACAYG
jgi:hypothetical protein